MSFLLEKSNQNFHALNFLFDKQLYGPCIHCGYYSCFQKITYILKDYYTDEYEYILRNLKGSKGTLHENCIKEFINKLRKIDHKDAAELNSLLRQLKNFRKKSDYDDDEITEEEGQKVKKYVTTIHHLIKHHMKL